MEVEDDLFFADLSKQISLLIMDDDEDPVARCPSVSFQAFSRANHPTAPSPFFYEQSCRRESKGTGVFIPQSTQPRRKHRQGRFSSFNSKSHRHHDKARTVSQVSYNHSFNSKKG
ncbi:hypothetical protein Pint_24885 [Pistacia integerrima]|uniref:Uncharacterized protein n=1 Tax=Pistacia integerrima TaxID=434235 RepID=A0ACC0YF01_9ROSI|nr:hypothetical protein Pint_24885 [Pistacia integerrima]